MSGIMQVKPATVDECRPVGDEMFKSWLAVRQFLQHAMGEKPITREQDAQFLQVKSQVSKSFSQLRTRLPRQMLPSPDTLQEVMKQALSVTHVRNLPTPDKRGLYRTWHSFYIEVAKLQGALRFMQEAKFYPKFDEKSEKASANIKESFVQESKSGKKRK